MSHSATRVAREAAANVALIAAACVPIALLAGTPWMAGVLGVVILASPLLSRSTPGGGALAFTLDSLRSTSVMLAGIALCALGVQLLCAAAQSEGMHDCERVCSIAFAAPPQACAGAATHRVDVSEINVAVIGAVFHPERYKTLQHRTGLVFLESLTLNGARYFRDTTALASLLRQAAPRHAAELARSFFAANARTSPVHQARRNFAEQVVLDSSATERFLTAATLAEVPFEVTSTLPRFSPGDTVPGVLALSSPGVDASRSLAIVLAVVRSPQSLAPDHVESTTLVLTERNGLAWRVRHEWSVTTK